MVIIENRTARSYVSLFVEIKPQRDRQTDRRTDGQARPYLLQRLVS